MNKNEFIKEIRKFSNENLPISIDVYNENNININIWEIYINLYTEENETWKKVEKIIIKYDDIRKTWVIVNYTWKLNNKIIGFIKSLVYLIYNENL